jgi:hypothetical protein
LRARPAEWELSWYLVSLRRALAQALEARRRWIPELRAMLEHAQQGDVAALVDAAGRIGASYGATFRACQDGLRGLNVPPEWTGCHASARSWFDRLVEACLALEAFGRTGDAALLREANDHIVTAGDLAATFNDEYARLSAPLRLPALGVRGPASYGAVSG